MEDLYSTAGIVCNVDGMGFCIPDQLANPSQLVPATLHQYSLFGPCQQWVAVQPRMELVCCYGTLIFPM